MFEVADKNAIKNLDVSVQKERMTVEMLSKISSRLANLESLNLSRCNMVTDKSMELLSSKCNQVTSLDLTGCSNIIENAIEALKTQYPHVEMRH